MKRILLGLTMALSLMVLVPEAKAEDVAVFVKGGISQTVGDRDLVNYGVGAAFSLPNKFSAPVEIVHSRENTLALAGIGFKVGTVKTFDVYATAQLGNDRVAGSNLVAEAFTVTAHKTVKGFSIGPSIRYTAVKGHNELTEAISVTKNLTFGKH
jgi:hypothetical protein